MISLQIYRRSEFRVVNMSTQHVSPLSYSSAFVVTSLPFITTYRQSTISYHVTARAVIINSSAMEFKVLLNARCFCTHVRVNDDDVD